MTIHIACNVDDNFATKVSGIIVIRWGDQW